MYFTHISEARILNAFLGQTAQAPVNLYVALMLSNPGDTGSGTEVSYPGYQRQQITFAAPEIVSGGISITNDANILFAESSASAGRATHLGLYDAQVGGNMLSYMLLDDPIQIEANISPLIVAREWVYRITGNASAFFATAMLNFLRGQNIVGFIPYCALFNGSPDEGGAELSGTAYERIPLSMTTPAILPTGQTRIATNAEATFNRALSSWGAWDNTVIYNAESGGNPLLIANRTQIAISRGRQVIIRQGDLAFSLS